MFLTATRRYMSSGISLRLNAVELTTWLWICCTVATLVNSQQNFYTNGRYGKRQDPDEGSTFWSGSRYGRSGDSAVAGSPVNGKEDKIDAGGAKDVAVMPRMDRFFLGSRYGKRTFSNDRRIDSLKQFETSLNLLISFGNPQTTDIKEHLKFLDQEFKDNENLATMKPGDGYKSSSGLIKGYGSLSENGFACLYTGFKNIYRCFRRRNYEPQEAWN